MLYHLSVSARDSLMKSLLTKLDWPRVFAESLLGVICREIGGFKRGVQSCPSSKWNWEKRRRFLGHSVSKVVKDFLMRSTSFMI